VTPTGVVRARASIATAAFSAAGAVALVLLPGPLAAKAPNAFFYAVLVLNTFLSIRFFDGLPPRERDERIIDAVLAVLYVSLAVTIGNPAWFAAVSTMLFAAAVAKYWLLLPVMPRPKLLRRKMRIDALGALLGALTLIASLLADALAAAWAQAILFAAANFYFLMVRPMYADDLDGADVGLDPRQEGIS
jgi:hypothetical protein